MKCCTRMYYWCFFVASVGRPKHVRVMAGALEGDIFIGPRAEVSVSLWQLIPFNVYTNNDFRRSWVFFFGGGGGGGGTSRCKKGKQLECTVLIS